MSPQPLCSLSRDIRESQHKSKMCKILDRVTVLTEKSGFRCSGLFGGMKAMSHSLDSLINMKPPANTHENPTRAVAPEAIFTYSDKHSGLYNHIAAQHAWCPSIPVSFSLGGTDDDCHNGHIRGRCDSSPQGRTWNTAWPIWACHPFWSSQTSRQLSAQPTLFFLFQAEVHFIQ